ncbi:hypothetical protein C4K04_3869 [Pseudomonas chlororaphis]|uniref:Uncharacterized protein n=1 Tax=Pseudomonas chlororaphis TaxID=587753 RepID=A0A3G7TSW9_9PSED|nr:hypothetical protein C4K04_3869 [Pseudomonas chlororaphis]
MFLQFYPEQLSALDNVPVHSGRMPGKFSIRSGLNLVHANFFQTFVGATGLLQAADFT